MYLILIKLLEKFNENAEVIGVTSAFFILFWIFMLRKQLGKSLAMLGMGFLAASFYGGLVGWAYGLGGDSFLESSDFAWAEVWVWLKSFAASLPYMVPKPKIWLFILGVSLGISLPAGWIARQQPHVIRAVLALLIVGHAGLAYSAYRGFVGSRQYVQDLKASFQEPVEAMGQAADVDLVLYIGESTSSLNMSLYGYPLKTTPRLDALQAEDAGFVRFDHVRSTQTHTSVSLLRALSLSSPKGTAGKRWGLGQVLKHSGVNAQLYSIQPLTGSFATFAKYIFDGVAYDLNAEDRFKGNFVETTAKDHELIPKVLGNSGITIFHSYAGHGEYLNFIASSLSSKVDFPKIKLPGIAGQNFSTLGQGVIKDVNEYNQAMTYIDRNVDQVMRDIRKRTKPAVVIYFSDHGDAVFTKRGHESSRYIDEMTTVPFVMYFNAAYIEKYPDVYRSYKNAAARENLKLLDQIVPTVLDVLRVKSGYPLQIPTMAQFAPHPNPVIMERSTLQGPSNLDFRYNDKEGFAGFEFSGGTPEPTLTWMINQQYKDQKTICYHRSNSYAKALRAASVAGCIEFDLVVEEDKLSIYHPPLVATGFEVEHMFAIASARKNKLWIDSKNLHDPVACHTLQRYLEKNHTRVGEIFVEFPAESAPRLSELRSCAYGLRQLGIRTSYYVPTNWLLPCAEDAQNNQAACISLRGALDAVMGSGLFSDLSFDFGGYPAMKRIERARKFKWNTWTVKPQDFHKLPREDFSYIIIDTSSDPNTY